LLIEEREILGTAEVAAIQCCGAFERGDGVEGLPLLSADQSELELNVDRAWVDLHGTLQLGYGALCIAITKRC
jgi:hypothetical protein